MKHRDNYGRFLAKQWLRRNLRFTGEITKDVVVGCVGCAILWAINIDMHRQQQVVEVIHTAHAAEVEEEYRREVRIQVVYNYTRDEVEALVRQTFPEAPNTATAIARCENGLRVEGQSNYILDYGREESFGVMQVHGKVHEPALKRLGLEDYKTNPHSNLAFARYLFEKAGNTFTDWTCYNTGQWRQYLR